MDGSDGYHLIEHLRFCCGCGVFDFFSTREGEEGPRWRALQHRLSRMFLTRSRVAGEERCGVVVYFRTSRETYLEPICFRVS